MAFNDIRLTKQRGTPAKGYSSEFANEADISQWSVGRLDYQNLL
jgi:hypothetical protein